MIGDLLLYWDLFQGGVAKWLGTGLQIRERRFESGHHLHLSLLVNGKEIRKDFPKFTKISANNWDTCADLNMQWIKVIPMDGFY